MNVSLVPAIQIIKEFEGCKLDAYMDLKGIWTIGYGETEKVCQGMKISQAEADAFLITETHKLMRRILPLLRVEVTDEQLCAMISLAYNIGYYNFVHSTLFDKLNAGKPKEEVAAEFLRWNRAGSMAVPGLTRRRQVEHDLFLTPVTVEVASNESSK